MFGPPFGRRVDSAPVFGGIYTSLVNLQLSSALPQLSAVMLSESKEPPTQEASVITAKGYTHCSWLDKQTFALLCPRYLHSPEGLQAGAQFLPIF